MSRRLFGYFGAALAPLIFAATAIYYAVFEGSVVAVALQHYFGGMAIQCWYLIIVAYSIPLVFGGIRVWLDKFNGVLLPFYIVGLAAALIWAGQRHRGRWRLAQRNAPAARRCGGARLGVRVHRVHGRVEHDARHHRLRPVW